MQEMANEFDKELEVAINNMDTAIINLSAALDTERLEHFDHMAGDKVELINAIKTQRINPEEFKTKFFEQLESMVTLSKNVDKTNLLFLEFVATSLDLREQRVNIGKTMAKLNVVDYLNLFQNQAIDSANLSTALNFTFADIMSDQIASSPPVSEKTAPFSETLPFESHVTPHDRIVAQITPDRGSGGIYRSSRHDKINFTIKSSRDCWFVLMHTNAAGEVKQLCPNEYYEGNNFLKAGEPKTLPGDMPYDFIAQEPLGVDSLTLMVSQDELKYNVELDKFNVIGMDRFVAWDKNIKTRGLKVQHNTNSFIHGYSYDKVVYDPKISGKVVIAETFIRVVQ